jgi:hypothetical protein
VALDYLSEGNFNSASGPSTSRLDRWAEASERSAVALVLRLIIDLGKCGLPSLMSPIVLLTMLIHRERDVMVVAAGPTNRLLAPTWDGVPN